jgi:protein XagA
MFIKKLTIFLLIILLLGFAYAPFRAFAQEYNLAAEALCSFGEAFLKAGRSTEARYEFQKCLLISPEHKKAKALLELTQEKPAEVTRKQPSPKKKSEITKQPTPKKPTLVTKDKVREKAIELALEEKEKAVKNEKIEAPAGIAFEEDKLSYVGGAWGLPKGHFLLESFLKFSRQDSQFDGDQRKQRFSDEGRGSEIRNEFKIDYGLLENFTVWLHIPYQAARFKNDFGNLKERGVGDIWLGGKYRFLDNPIALSLELANKFPAGYNANHSPSLGNGQIDHQLTLLSAKVIDPVYFKVESGYRWRNEEPADLIPYFFEVGYKPWDRVLFKAYIDGVESLSGAGNLEDYTKWVTGVLFTLQRGVNPYTKQKDQFGIEAGYGEVFAGKNTSASSEIYAKILYYF